MANSDYLQEHNIWNLDIGSLIRHEELNGRKYTVVPMVMILEGVHTGSQGPVYYSMDELAKTPKMWNMKPIVIEHPFQGDTATDLEVYKKQAVGMIMNTHFIDGKLKAEAWIDDELVAQKCPDVITHIENKLPMEISTGLFSELVMEEGVWNGEPYRGRIINIRADHLAILPTQQGACSLCDGAGLLINQRQEAKDTLNIISTVINSPSVQVNNDYVAGSLVDEHADDLQIDYDKTKKQKADSAPDGDVIAQKIESIETTPQVFTTPEGYTITITPPRNPTLTNPKNLPLEEGVIQDDTVSEAVPDLQEAPIHDNAHVVDTTTKHTKDEVDSLFIESLHKAMNAALRLRNAGVDLEKDTLPTLEEAITSLQDEADLIQERAADGEEFDDGEIQKIVHATEILQTVGEVIEEVEAVENNLDKAVGVYNESQDPVLLATLVVAAKQFPELLKVNDTLNKHCQIYIKK